jgi:hypothetical protein
MLTIVVKRGKREVQARLPRLSPQVETGGVHGNIPRSILFWKTAAAAAQSMSAMTFSLRKEVIQPQVLLRLPCYDFTPIMSYTLDGCFLAVSPPASSTAHFRDVTGGVYKARERIHRGVLIRDY